MNKPIATVKIEIDAVDDEGIMSFGKKSEEICMSGVEEFFEPFDVEFEDEKTYWATVWNEPSLYRFRIEFLPVGEGLVFSSFRIVDDNGKEYIDYDLEILDDLAAKLFLLQDLGKKFYIGLEQEV